VPNLLPVLVSSYVENALAGAGACKTVRLDQVGEMVLKPGARARLFTAREEFLVDRVGLTWQARFPLVGPISMRVTDSYHSGQGLLEVRVLGLPLQRKRGPELARGEAFRYLAEIPWTPHAMLANRELRWRELDARVVEVATDLDGERVAVRLIFDEHGDIMQTIAERPRVEAGNALTPWIGEYRDYEVLGGVRIPTRGAVRWDLPEGPFTYWRGTITALELL